MYGSHGAGGVRIIPETKMKDYTPLPRRFHEFLATIAIGWMPSATARKPVPISRMVVRSTEIAMLGVIAIKMPGTKLAWDAEAMRFTNCDDGEPVRQSALSRRLDAVSRISSRFA